MAKPEEKNRTYTGSDAEMVQASRVTHGLFLEDKTLFKNFDNAFDDPFAQNWLVKIEEAVVVYQDTTNVAELTERTKAVEIKMEECRALFQQIKYFVEKAFPSKREIWAQFGFNDYEEARKSETKMIRLLGIIDKTALNYKNDLIAAGFSETDIAKINALQVQLIDADYQQEIHKKKRPALTQQRITILNDCYTFMQRVSKASKIIFKTDKAKIDQYLLPSERAPKPEEIPAN
jgi:hypothetical protein